MSVKGEFMSFSQVNINGRRRESGIIGDFDNGTLRYRRFGNQPALSPGPMALLAVPPARLSLEDQLQRLLPSRTRSRRRSSRGRSRSRRSRRRGSRRARSTRSKRTKRSGALEKTVTSIRR